MEMKKAWVYGIDVQPLELEFLNGVTQIFFVIDVFLNTQDSNFANCHPKSNPGV